MTRGAPDWHNVRSDIDLSRVRDVGELAARLWSPNVFERRGDVLWMEQFDHGLTSWLTAITAVNGEVAVTADQSAHGGFSIRMTCGTDSGQEAILQRTLAFPAQGKYGIEVGFTFDTNLVYFSIQVLQLQTAPSYRLAVWYDPVNDRIQYFDVNGDTQTLATGVDRMPADYLFHTFKVVADFKERQYHRVLLDSVGYPMADIALQPVAQGGGPAMVIDFTAVGDSATSSVVHVDHVIVTRNEV